MCQKIRKRERKKVNDFFETSLFVGVSINLISYFLGVSLKKRFKNELLNPLLISILVTIIVLVLLNIDYDIYYRGAMYISCSAWLSVVCV